MSKKNLVAIFFIVLVLILSIDFLVFNTTNRKIKSLNEKITKSELLIEQKNEEIDKKIESIKSSEEDLAKVKKKLVFLMASFEISNEIVTDQVIIKKANLHEDVSTIDISPQPIMSYHFKGMGKFDLSDRELKVMLLGIIKRLETWYNQQSALGSFSSIKLIITSNNYEVATYENEILKLKGE